MSPDIETTTLYTRDAVKLRAAHLGDSRRRHAIVLLHGFSGGWRHPRTRHIAAVLRDYGGVIAVDLRGHGASSGVSTVGDKEIHDVEAAVGYARDLGYETVSLLGFSMGACVAVRHGALYGGVQAVAAVSGPAHWYYRGSTPMRWLHRGVESRAGRIVSRLALRTRISSGGWPRRPSTPEEVAGKIAPAPLLVVHGDADAFFPVRHAHAIFAAAAEPKELWIEHGMGHAESAMNPALVRRIGVWLARRAAETVYE